ncbi:MAG: GIY-YIG nuclease family protein [Rhizonema sp. NSF051]|nr:GIY-YIG nuclease family protein [Rhizonema sp. NSF051]
MNVITLEQINLLDLPSLPLSRLGELPEVKAIYFSFSDEGEVLYIGQTTNLKNRWVSHHRFKELATNSCIKVAWLEITDEYDLNSIEELAIKHFKPTLNWKRNAFLNEINRGDKAIDQIADIERRLVVIERLADRLTTVERLVLCLHKIKSLKAENQLLKEKNDRFKVWRDLTLAVTTLAPTDTAE